MAGAVKSLGDLITLCKGSNRADKLKTITKDVMADILANSPSPEPEPTQNELLVLMRTMATEMAQIKSSNTRVVEALNRIEAVEEKLKKTEMENSQTMQALTAENEKMHRMILNQQVFLEGLDAKERRCNAVVLGLPEDDHTLGENDEEKLNAVLQATGAELAREMLPTLKRLGKPNPARPRPTLLVFPSEQARNEILTKAKNFKQNQSDR